MHNHLRNEGKYVQEMKEGANLFKDILAANGWKGMRAERKRARRKSRRRMDGPWEESLLGVS